jgi:hypothetical protein
VDRICSMHREIRNAYVIFRKSYGCRWDDNIKMYLKRVRVCVDQIEFPRGMVQG